MKCNEILSYLNSYADVELPGKQMLAVEWHLETCAGCRDRLERILRLNDLLGDGPHVLPVPERLAANVMAEACKMALPDTNPKRTRPWAWEPIRWFAVSSAPMRIAAVVILIVGLAAGALMGRDIWQPPAAQVIASERSEAADIIATYNLDYLTDAPSGSLPQVYMALVSAKGAGGQ